MFIWLQFIGTAAIIFVSGRRLSIYADVIAEKTGLGRTLIGLALLAWITSLPELITGVASVLVHDLPEIAVGNVLGSCMFNILIITLLDRLSPTPILSAVRGTHRLVAAFGLLMLSLVTATLLAGLDLSAPLWFSWSSVAVIPVWFVALEIVRRSESGSPEGSGAAVDPVRYSETTLGHALRMFSLNAAFTVGAAMYLPGIGEQIAEMTGLGQTFVGNVFVGLSTSLPELVVSVAALRIGAAELAVANVLGSNLFNIVVLALEDFFYLKGPILAAVSPNHGIPSNAAMAMTALVLVGLAGRRSRRLLSLSPVAWGILAIYLAATGLLLMSS